MSSNENDQIVEKMKKYDLFAELFNEAGHSVYMDCCNRRGFSTEKRVQKGEAIVSVMLLVSNIHFTFTKCDI